MKIDYKNMNPIIRILAIIILLFIGIVFFSIGYVYYFILEKLFGVKYE